MSEDEQKPRLVGVPCPVPNCRGYVKNISDDDHEELVCDYGHILEYED
jgi:hypothetical protein